MRFVALVSVGVPLVQAFLWATNGTTTTCEVAQCTSPSMVLEESTSTTDAGSTLSSTNSSQVSQSLSNGNLTKSQGLLPAELTSTTAIATNSSSIAVQNSTDVTVVAPASTTSFSMAFFGISSSNTAPTNATGLRPDVTIPISLTLPPGMTSTSTTLGLDNNSSLADPGTTLTTGLRPTAPLNGDNTSFELTISALGIPASSPSTRNMSLIDVTATITTLPSGVSTEPISLLGVSKNTWYTTTKDSHTTILPVIWRSSDDHGELILIWGFASGLTNIKFAWPQMPEFSFSCIKVFGVTIGDCLAGKSESDEDNDEGKSSSSSTSTSSSAIQASSSTSESCSSATASDCRVGCLVSTFLASSTTTVCYTTSCWRTVGCSVQATTTTSVTTSSRSQTMLEQNPTPYNAAATWSSLGMGTLAWCLGATLTISNTDAEYTPGPEDSGDDDSDDEDLEYPSDLGASASASDKAPWCYIYGDSSSDYHCECGSGENMVTSPVVSGACPYTSHSIISTILPATSTAAAQTITHTNFDGSVQECTSFSQLTNGVHGSVCIGPTIVTLAPVVTKASPTSAEPLSTSVVPPPKASCDRAISNDANSWTVQGRGWFTGSLKRNIKACGSLSDWKLDKLADDPDGWEFQVTFQMNSDYDYCIKSEIKGSVNC